MKTTYYVAASLDGYIAEADGGVNFLSEFDDDPDPASYESIKSVDALLMGRRTYDQVLGFGEWPYGELPCWVLTSRDLAARPEPISAISGSADSVHNRIRGSGAQHLWLVGGAHVASQFLSAGLIDSAVVSVVPIVLGQGVPLFSGLSGTVALDYQAALPRANGIVELQYAAKNGS